MDQESLIGKYGNPENCTNSAIIAIYKDALQQKGTGDAPAKWVKLWANRPEISTHSLKIEITYKKMLKLRREAREKFKDEIFTFPVESRSLTIEHQTDSVNLRSLPPNPPPIPSTSTSQPCHVPSPSPVKRQNLMKHKIEQDEKRLVFWQKKIEKAKTELSVMRNRQGHFSIKNVRKIEERDAKMRTALRTEKNEYRTQVRKQAKEIVVLKEKLDEMTEKMKEMESTIESSVIEKKELEELKVDKRKAQKRASFHMKEKQKVLKDLKDMEQSLKMDDEDKHTMEGGKYKESIRMCMLELTALDATGKIGDVINCVAQNIFTTKRQACQNIVDEGQFIVKSMIEENLKECKGWGLHKDGTRKNFKILDTSIQIDDGASFCLGLLGVVSETAEAIASETKEKIGEVEKALDEEGCRKELINKLSYFMNDRVANEKKSSSLLEEWRNKMLIELGQEQTSNIDHLYCTAHVLAFQSYTLKSLNSNTTGQLKHPILIMLRDAADLFGPVGDFRAGLIATDKEKYLGDLRRF